MSFFVFANPAVKGNIFARNKRLRRFEAVQSLVQVTDLAFETFCNVVHLFADFGLKFGQ